MCTCFKETELLIPSHADLSRWSVIACDQYTSQPEYWKKVEEIVGDAPSTLNLIYPEVYLSEGDGRIKDIHMTMRKYLKEDILDRKIQGYVLLARETPAGVRIGLVGALDLDSYEFTSGTHAKVRATEQTVASRIPPRMKIRRGAEIESSHVMVLLNDEKEQLLEVLYENRDKLPIVYNVQLMMDGGHLTGYAVEGEMAAWTTEKLTEMEKEAGEFFLAIGDGNHSVATAKACWEEIRQGLTPEEQAVHPAREAMVELVNLYNPALKFESIHRAMFHDDIDRLTDAFRAYLKDKGIEPEEGKDIRFRQNDAEIGFALPAENKTLAVQILQPFLDSYLEEHKETSIDYIHGEKTTEEMAVGDVCGVILGEFDKQCLFPTILKGGVLPRKSFSMGEAFEKRYYMECRRILPEKREV